MIVAGKMTPADYVKRTLGLFPQGTAILIVVPSRDGDTLTAAFDGLREIRSDQAFNMLAMGMATLEKAVLANVGAVMEQAKAMGMPKTEDEVFEFFRQAMNECREASGTYQDAAPDSPDSVP